MVSALEVRHDVYLSVVFSHPITGQAAFRVFLGPAPHELHQEWAEAPALQFDSPLYRVVSLAQPAQLRLTLEVPQGPLVAETALVASSEAELPAPGLWDATRPRDLLEGLGSGLTCCGAGFAAGGCALVALPALGLSEAGLQGFALGAAKGLSLAAALALGGSAAGCAQVMRGVLNTPEVRLFETLGSIFYYIVYIM